MKVFVYGSLMKDYENHCVMEEAKGKFISKAITSNKQFKLLSINDYYPTIDKGNYKIQGEIYEVDENGLNELDSLERYPQLYDRKEFLFDTDNGQIKALIYIMTNDYKNRYKNHFKTSSKRIFTFGDYQQWMLN